MPGMWVIGNLPQCLVSASLVRGLTSILGWQYTLLRKVLHGTSIGSHMDEFRHSVADALRYWEPRRVFYNAVLAAVAVSWVVLTWPHFRSMQLMGIPRGDTHPALLILIVLAFLANVCYCAAYLVDIPLQLTFVMWRKYRWALLLIGTFFAMLIENYWIADEIYPFVPK